MGISACWCWLCLHWFATTCHAGWQVYLTIIVCGSQKSEKINVDARGWGWSMRGRRPRTEHEIYWYSPGSPCCPWRSCRSLQSWESPCGW